MSDLPHIPHLEAALDSLDAANAESAADWQEVLDAQEHYAQDQRQLLARIEVLEKAVAALLQHGPTARAPVADQPHAPAVRAPHREPEVSIAYAPAPRPVSVDTQPNAEELRALRVICAREYRAFVEDNNEWLLQFSRGILALSHMRKLPKPDQKRYAHDLATHAKTVLRSIGRHTGELGGAPFILACLVMDVPVSGFGAAQCSTSLGLTMFDGVGVAIEPSAWRVTLKSGALPKQFPVERIVEAPSPVRVYGF